MKKRFFSPPPIDCQYLMHIAMMLQEGKRLLINQTVDHSLRIKELQPLDQRGDKQHVAMVAQFDQQDFFRQDTSSLLPFALLEFLL